EERTQWLLRQHAWVRQSWASTGSGALCGGGGSPIQTQIRARYDGAMKTKSIYGLLPLLSTCVVVLSALLLSACASSASVPPGGDAAAPAASAEQGASPAAEAASTAAPAPAGKAAKPLPTADFKRWLATFRARAVANGVAPATVARAFSGVRLEPRILALDDRQPE